MHLIVSLFKKNDANVDHIIWLNRFLMLFDETYLKADNMYSFIVPFTFTIVHCLEDYYDH